MCREVVVVFKEYNVKRQYKIKHKDNMKCDKEVKQLKFTEFKFKGSTKKCLVQQNKNILRW